MTPAAERAMQDVLEKFKTGELSEVIRISAYDLPEGWPSSRWSLGNKMLAYMQARTLNIRGFQQWKEVKRQVKSGARALYIWSPRTIKKDDNGEERRQLIGFMPIPVFSYASTEGEELSDDWKPRQLPPLYELSERLGIQVNYQPVAPDRLGDCGGGQINLGTSNPAVFWHEIGHAIHAATDPNYKTETSAFKETVAEFTACVIAALYGLDYTGNTWQYLQQFNDDPIKAVMKAGQQIQAILDFIQPTQGEVKQ